jgi:hypothetical protein
MAKSYARDSKGKFQVGNPGGGRPMGSLNRSTLIRRDLLASVPDILRTMRRLALNGDTAAAKLVLNTSMAPLKPESLPVEMQLPTGGGLGDQARAILERVATGEVSPTAAAELLGALSAAAQVIEASELEKRLGDIERLLAADKEHR